MISYDKGFFDLTGESEKDIKTIADDLYSLRQDLQYSLTHIDKSNMTSAYNETEDGVEIVQQDGDDIASLRITTEGIKTEVKNAQGDISTLEQTADKISTKVEDIEGNYSTIEQKADSISTKVESMAGDISTVEQKADSLVTRVTNAEGNIIGLDNDIIGINNDIVDINNDIEALDESTSARMTEIEQTASGITTRVVAVEGDVNTLDGRVDTAEGNITTLSGSISTVDQKADTISANVTNLDGRFTDFQQDVDGWTFKIGDGTTERDISINNGTVDLRDFDVTAKSLASVSSSGSVLIDDGTISIKNRNGVEICEIYNGNEFVNIASMGGAELLFNGIPYNNCFQAYRSTDTPLGQNGAGDYMFGFETVDQNIGNLFSLDGGSVVCSQAGKVEVSGQVDTVLTNAQGKQIYIKLYKNGSSAGYFTRTTTTDYTTALFPPRIINVSAGDKLSFRVHTVTGVTGTANGGRYFNFINLRYIA